LPPGSQAGSPQSNWLASWSSPISGAHGTGWRATGASVSSARNARECSPAVTDQLSPTAENGTRLPTGLWQFDSRQRFRRKAPSLPHCSPSHMTLVRRSLIPSLLCTVVSALALTVVFSSWTAQGLRWGDLETYRMLALTILGLVLGLGAVQARQSLRPHRHRMAEEEPELTTPVHPSDEIRGLGSSLTHM